MVVECVTIFGLIFVVAVMYIRAKKRNYALATVPLLILPAANVLAYAFSGGIAGLLSIDRFIAYSAIDIVAAVVSSCLVGLMSGKFGKKSVRGAYIAMSLIFNIVLAAILIYNMFEDIYR
ncbi:MAG: hypothetical protein NC253_02830 [Ruminococcus sp.]|nr:hypothetical protein [Ruminococcus sp.]MCM1381303.1 hypothetical protein [Muribaculaceae bacterium]MCM1480326.1 hypothetical protein [Muribaculaceae bacterium]